MKRITFQLLPVLLFFSSIIYSCNGELIPANKMPSINVKFNGSTNGEMKFEGKCDKVFAMYSPEDPSSGFRFLNIQGTDGNKSFNIVLYWSGAFPSPAQFDLDLNASSGSNYGIGQYIPEILNSTNTYQSTYGTAGNCKIIQYDQSKQTVSGTFQFSAELMINGSSTGNITNFTGDFNNIPINDMTDPNNPKGPCFNSTGNPLGSGGSGGTGGGGGTTSTITFKNQTFTPITISFNGQTKTAAAGMNAIFSGNPNSTATGSASTSGKTTSGTQVGLLMNWPLSIPFPAAGTNYNYSLGLGPDYFFLKLKNQSNRNILKLYVNYGITAQTLDNVSIPNNGSLYNLGYYRAYLHSNVRAENGIYFWYWNALNLPLTNNQSVTVVAN